MEECPFHAKAESLLAVRGLLSPWSDEARSPAYSPEAGELVTRQLLPHFARI